MMLLAPNTRWAMVNLSGSVGGKYGAKTHLSTHRRLRILQAAQGLRTTGWGGEEGEDGGGWVRTLVGLSWGEVLVLVLDDCEKLEAMAVEMAIGEVALPLPSPEYSIYDCWRWKSALLKLKDYEGLVWLSKIGWRIYI